MKNEELGRAPAYVTQYRLCAARSNPLLIIENEPLLDRQPEPLSYHTLLLVISFAWQSIEGVLATNTNHVGQVGDNAYWIQQTTDGGYILVAGERRFRAATSLQWETIPALVRDDADLYLEVEDSFFRKKSVRPTYILTNNSAIPYHINSEPDNPQRSNVDSPLFLDELIKFKALKKMMDFRIMKEGVSSGASPAILKYILFAALLVGGYVFIRYFWLGSGS